MFFLLWKSLVRVPSEKNKGSNPSGLSFFFGGCKTLTTGATNREVFFPLHENLFFWNRNFFNTKCRKWETNLKHRVFFWSLFFFSSVGKSYILTFLKHWETGWDIFCHLSFELTSYCFERSFCLRWGKWVWTHTRRPPPSATHTRSLRIKLLIGAAISAAIINFKVTCFPFISFWSKKKDQAN